MPVVEEVNWSKGRRTAFEEWLSQQITNVEGDRADLVDKWKDDLTRWRAKTPDGSKEWPFAGAPYSRDTEILTRFGWKRVDEVEIGEYVLTREDETGELEWNPVQARPAVWVPELLHFESRTIDLLVSPAHTMVVENQHGDVKRMAAEELWNTTGYYIPLVGDFEGVDTQKLFGLDAEDVSEFIGWYLAEGSTGNGGTIHLAQKKEEGRSAIKALLDRLGFSYQVGDSTIYVHARSVPDDLRDFIDGESWCHEKSVPKFFYGASPRLIRALLRGLLGGDGHTRWDNGYQKTTYYTTSPDLADDFQALTQLMGMRASVRTRDRRGSGSEIDGRKIKTKRKSISAGLLRSERAKLKKHHFKKRVEYNDFAYCVTVENHAVYVRRNGKAAWSGNSNVKFPLTAIHSDPVAADFLQTIHATDEFWNVEPRRSQTIEAANAWREGLRYIDEDFLKMREVNKRAIPLTIVHGTGVYKSHWLHERVPRKDYNAAGEIEKRIVGRSHPVIDQVPLQRFYFPADSWSLRWEDQGGARWVAEKHIFTPNQLRAKAKSEELIQPAWDKNAVDFVVNFTEELAGDNEVDEKLRDQSEFKPHREMKIEVFEVWARFDTDGDGIADNVQIMWHQPTGTILRALHNPFLHGKRPYESVQYLPYPGIYGIGLAEADKWAQKTLTKLINAQVDNVLLANTRMFSAPLGGAIEPGEPIYPGKIWLHGPGEDIEAMQAGEVYPSLPNAIGQFLEISEQRTGVSELRQGNITALPSRTPASTALSVLQEGSKRFNMILGNMREPFGQLGLRVMQNLAQYFREDKVKWARYFRNAMGQEDAQQFLQQLDQPIHDVEDGFSVSLRATGAQSNKEAERQQFLQLISIVAQTYAQILQTVQLIENAPPDSAVRKTATKAYQAGVHMLEQLLERFDLQNVEQITPELRQFQNQRQQALQQARQNGVQFAPLGGPQGADPLGQAQQAIAQGFGIGGL